MKGQIKFVRRDKLGGQVRAKLPPLRGNLSARPIILSWGQENNLAEAFN